MSGSPDDNDILREQGADAVRARHDATTRHNTPRTVNNNASSRVDDPIPLTAEIPPCGAFPTDALGPKIAPTVRALHESAVQAPEQMCATAALAAAALSVQGIADLRLPTDEVVPLSVFCLTIAESGERKTSLDKRVLRGCRDHEKELVKQWKAEKKNFERAKESWDQSKSVVTANARKNKWSKEDIEDELRALGDAPEEPAYPFFIVEEPTMEALIKLTIGGQRSIGLFSAEAGNFVGGHSMSTEKRTSTVAKLNGYWDGNGVERFRASDDPSVKRDVRLSMHLSIQPEHGRALFTDTTVVDLGLISRLLPVAPQSAIGTRFGGRPTDQQMHDLLEFTTISCQRRQTEAPKDPETGEVDIPVMVFSEEADEAFRLFNMQVEQAMAEDGDYCDIRGFASKMPQHAARIAAILALFEDGAARTIGQDHFARATRIVQFYASEHLRLQGVTTASADMRDAAALSRWLRETWHADVFAVTQVMQHGPNPLRKADRIRELINILERNGHVCRMPGGAAVPLPRGGTKRHHHAWRIAGKDSRSR